MDSLISIGTVFSLTYLSQVFLYHMFVFDLIQCQLLCSVDRCRCFSGHTSAFGLKIILGKTFGVRQTCAFCFRLKRRTKYFNIH